jgi:hypothetical protein
MSSQYPRMDQSLLSYIMMQRRDQLSLRRPPRRTNGRFDQIGFLGAKGRIGFGGGFEFGRGDVDGPAGAGGEEGGGGEIVGEGGGGGAPEGA